MAPVQFEEGSEERLVVAIAAAVEDQDVCNLFDVVALCCINMRSVPASPALNALECVRPIEIVRHLKISRAKFRTRSEDKPLTPSQHLHAPQSFPEALRHDKQILFLRRSRLVSCQPCVGESNCQPCVDVLYLPLEPDIRRLHLVPLSTLRHGRCLQERAAHLPGLLLENLHGVWPLRRCEAEHSWLKDPCFLKRDFFDCVAQHIGMIEPERGNSADYRRDYVGCIKPSSETDLNDGNVDGLRKKDLER
mmetsp:Transcript_6089/g.14053  ORF Transcript_6089/g.14053 Transcript_6089/m.14053 type:complete len:249 (-) Transcript_6089:656-1402(-)